MSVQITLVTLPLIVWFILDCIIKKNHLFFFRESELQKIFLKKNLYFTIKKKGKKTNLVYSIESHYGLICLKCVFFLWVTFFSIAFHVLTFIAVSSAAFFFIVYYFENGSRLSKVFS